MAQSLVKNYIHLVFSTKQRHPFIDESIENELFNYLGGICKNLECQPIIVGGHADHVHILCLLSRKIALMKLLEEVKSHSSKWIKTKGESYKSFYWQDGYGAFSVNPKEVDIVIKYIANQREHHTRKTFQREFLQFLEEYKVEYDERYIWV
ncbi:transposase [Paludibacter propionicigenes WB4]|uniref:Transposase n=1 Tax=Paludibacter propionicigenes (strain DSM 17365 / JCM 13257 / WB4) TaxID=694427 RepID=E4T0X6_PALPW|nr:IS200/IS605 family transposase [Paludibacter propionicigenes]ADQ78357.1 transposase [Paludibacter propionicigenes WB4]